MSAVQQLRQVCLMEANGDINLALTIACRKAEAWFLATSSGYVREDPAAPIGVRDPRLPRKETALPYRKPIKDPVLIEGEK